MTDTERKELQARIQTEIDKVRSDVADLKEQAKPVAPENAIGRVSRMDHINNKAVQEAALVKAKEKLTRLEEMLAKSDRSDFGVCIRCKKPIPILRLMYYPSSNKCVKCSG